MQSYELKYGCNPHQKPAFIRSTSGGELPFQVLNGNPGYINFLDAMNAWQLVRELKAVLGLPAATSFKHVSPAGAAIGLPLTDVLKQAYQVGDVEMSPIATAYARARGADRMSSFGDWAAMSDVVDVPTALLLKREVSDGVIAPGYEPEALDILKQKKAGKYAVIQMDPSAKLDETDKKTICGVEFVQGRNAVVPGFDYLNNIVTDAKELPESAKRDLVIAMITLKYTQSNSVCYTLDGQVIGCGAGQQSRIHCTRLAGDKADIWRYKQHPKVLGLKFKKDVKRPDRDNAMDLFTRNDITEREFALLGDLLEVVPERLTVAEKEEWLKGLSGVSLGSDAFFPFRDNIDRARRSGVKYVAQPGGSVRDDVVVQACNEYGMVMAVTGLRLFHH